MHAFALLFAATMLSPAEASPPTYESPHAAELRYNPRVTLRDVVTMTQQGVGDDIIINQVRTSGAAYRLSGDNIVWLKQNGVHDCVIEAMQAKSTPPVGVGVVIHGGRRW